VTTDWSVLKGSRGQPEQAKITCEPVLDPQATDYSLGNNEVSQSDTLPYPANPDVGETGTAPPSPHSNACRLVIKNIVSY
jgi:hypothetical protein